MTRGEMKRMGIEKLLREKYEYIFIPESHSELEIVKRNNQVKFIPYTLETETLSYKNNFYEDALLERGRRLGEFIVASNIVPGKTAAMIYNEYTAAGAVDVFTANSIKVPDDIKIITKGGMSEANYFQMDVESWIYPCQGMYQAIIDWIEDKYESGKITEFSNFLKTTNKKRR
jgi:DNA-binding LacI/PurR family transcriptional regulator